MSNAQSYIDRIEDIDAQIKLLQVQRAELIDEFAGRECSIKVGTTVTVNGYSHRGKKMMVRKICVERDFRGYRFKATGSVIKKDGEPGHQAGEWTQGINHNGKKA